MPEKKFHYIGARGVVVMFATVLAAWMLVSCAPWYRAYDIGSDEDLTKISAVPELRKALKDGDPDVRTQAAMAIKRIGPDAKDAMSDLVDALDDDNYDVRRETANAMESLLGISEEKEKGKADEKMSAEDRDLMVMVHINRLESRDWTARRDAANKLAQMGPDAAKAVPALVAAMLDESDWGRLYNEVRRASAMALGEIRHEARAANQPLIKASAFYDYDVRLEAVKALGKIGPKSETAVIEALKAALKDPDFDVRREAANSLGGFEVYADSTVPNLIKALSDMDFDVRREAAESLGRIGPKTDASVEALMRAMNDVDADVRGAATQALANVQPDDRAKVLPEVLLRLDDTEEDVRIAAVRTIAKFRTGNEETLQALDRVGHEDKSFVVKKSALETLYVLNNMRAGSIKAASQKSRKWEEPLVAMKTPVAGLKTTARQIQSTVDILNIRAMPSVSSKRVGKLLRNEGAVVTGILSEWLKIEKADGVTGYVAREYTTAALDAGMSETVEAAAVPAAQVVEVIPPAPAAVVAAVPAIAKIRSTADVLNIRAVPDIKGNRVGKLFPNETATVLETQAEWLKIEKADGVTGYVAREYTTAALETGMSETVEAAAVPAAQAAVIVAVPAIAKIRSTADVLNIRAVPDIKGNRVGKLFPNETATVLEAQAEWLKIEKTDGVTGYVAREYTTSVSEAEGSDATRVPETEEAEAPAIISVPAPVAVAPVVETVASAPAVAKVRSTAEALEIRMEPYGSESVGQLLFNEEAEVIETLAEWIKIKKADGTTGYVFKEYTSPVK